MESSRTLLEKELSKTYIEEKHADTKKALRSKNLTTQYVITNSYGNFIRELSSDEEKKVFHKRKKHFIFMDNKGVVYSQEERKTLSEEEAKNRDIKEIQVTNKNTFNRQEYLEKYKNQHVITDSNGNLIRKLFPDEEKKVFPEGKKHFIFMDNKGIVYSQEERKTLSEEEVKNRDIKKIQVTKKNNFKNKKYLKNAENQHVITDSYNNVIREFSSDEEKKVFPEGGKHFIFMDNKGTVYSEEERKTLSEEEAKNRSIEKIQVIKKSTFKNKKYQEKHKNEYVITDSSKSNIIRELSSNNEEKKIFPEGGKYFIFIDNKDTIYSQEEREKLSEDEAKNRGIEKIQVITRSNFNNRKYMENHKNQYVITDSYNNVIRGFSSDEEKKVFPEGRKYFIFMDNKDTVYSQKEKEKLSEDEAKNRGIEKIQVIKKSTLFERSKKRSSQQNQTKRKKSKRSPSAPTENNAIAAPNEINLLASFNMIGSETEFPANDINYINVSGDDISAFKELFGEPYHPSHSLVNDTENQFDSRTETVETTTGLGSTLSEDISAFKELFGEPYHPSHSLVNDTENQFDSRTETVETPNRLGSTPSEDISAFEELFGKPYHSSVNDTENQFDSRIEPVETTTGLGGSIPLEDISAFGENSTTILPWEDTSVTAPPVIGNNSANTGYQHYGLFGETSQPLFKAPAKKNTPH